MLSRLPGFALIAVTWLAPGCGLFSAGTVRPPNVVLIVADDLGHRELGCYGQDKIRYPHLDKLARGGMRFTQAYAGSSLGAPSQCVLLTGLHTGHAAIRDHRPRLVDGREVGQHPLPQAATTIAEVLGGRGYLRGAFGKWSLGGAGTPGHPNAQGFDEFFGFLCGRRARLSYPAYLWQDDQRVPLPGNQGGGREQFALDEITERAIDFVRRQDGRRPFFLYLALPAPNGDLQVPADSLAQYKGMWREIRHRGASGQEQPRPRAAHAARITRMDECLGRLLAILAQRGLADDTLVLFTSDNGPTDRDGIDTAFFASSAPFRGMKDSLYEGGLRVPLLARWPGRIADGTTSHHLCGSWDLLPTLAALAKVEPPEESDGKPLLPTLFGRPDQQVRHGYLYWEHRQSQQALRMDRWKALRLDTTGRIELYDLAADVAESQDVAADHGLVIRQVELILSAARTPSTDFPLRR